MEVDTLHQRSAKTIQVLAQLYPTVPAMLQWANGYQLLIAVILSANTTDRQVNRVTPQLFSAFPTARDMAACNDAHEITPYIRSVGLYRTKAVNILRTARQLVALHNGEPPQEFAQLLALPGVGRKTANVIRGTLYGLPAIIVDTHFSRVVQRLGISDQRSPAAIEREISALIASSEQYPFSQRVNWHGRVCCHAQKPHCVGCALRHLCRYFLSENGRERAS